MIGRCPRCGIGPLFKGVLKLQPSCASCGLNFARYDQGDGPAAFAIFFVGIVIMGAALLLEFTLHPPFWLHIVLWTPLTLGFTVFCLRLIKSILVQQQYKHLPPEEPPSLP